MRQDDRGIEVALLNRAQDTREHFLRMRAAGGPIAAADFAGDDRGAQCVLGAPVGGVNRVGVEEEGEDGRKFDGEIRREVLRDTSAAWSVDEGIQLILQMASRNGDAMGRYFPRSVAVADRQRVLQRSLHGRREMMFALIADPWATVTGVVSDMRHQGYRGQVKPEIYLPYTDTHARLQQVTLLVSMADRTASLEAIRQIVAAGGAFENVETASLEHVAAKPIQELRFATIVMIKLACWPLLDMRLRYFL